MNRTVPARKRCVATFTVLFLLLTAPDVWACPGCTYERMLLSNWYQKIWIIKLSLPLVFAFNRLDIVRVFYAFFAYTFGFIIAYRYLVWFSHPAVSDGFINTISLFGLIILMLSIPDAVLMYFLNRLPFFRRNKEKGLPIWQIIAFPIAACAISWLVLPQT